MRYFTLSEAEDAYCFSKNILLLSILPVFHFDFLFFLGEGLSQLSGDPLLSFHI